MAEEIPDKFLGKFKLDRSECFDDYLASRGVNWFLRKIICFSSITKTFEKAKPVESEQATESSVSNLYNMYNTSAKSNTAYEGWKLGETFEGMGLDGKQHKVSFWLEDNDTLAEKHIRMDNPGDPGEIYHYTLNDHGQLVLKMENGSIVARRYFNKIS